MYMYVCVYIYIYIYIYVYTVYIYTLYIYILYIYVYICWSGSFSSGKSCLSVALVQKSKVISNSKEPKTQQNQ